ncbi:MOSC domain-containing protein [bacterium]|nr:MOSC domain-containing protein [bacterium]MBP9810993.1 MOSC domain-containing protein [bacterium]
MSTSLTSPPLTVTSLTIYPVKSLAGISLHSAKLENRGFKYDREWMVVTEGGQFLTQRELAPMALIQTAILEHTLRLTMPLGDSIEVPLSIEAQGNAKGMTVKVWNDTCQAVDQGEEAATLLSHYLERKVRLVRMEPSFNRIVDQQYANSPANVVGFADGFPVLVISDESLTELNRRLEYPLPMNRFRPNITVGGSAPFAEDGWSQISIGGVTLSLVKPCDRCQMTTIDQDTAEASQEPLKTLSYFRKENGKVMFGQNAIPQNYGEIRLGDSVLATAK